MAFSNRLYWYAAFSLLLMLLRLCWMLAAEPVAVGDGVWFLEMARSISETSELAPLTVKPKGFPLYLVLVDVLFDGDLVLTQAAVAAVLDNLVLLGLAAMAVRHLRRRSGLCLLVVGVLFAQPFSGYFANQVVVEPLLSFVLFLSLACVYTSERVTHRSRAVILCCFAAGLLGLASLLRSEMFVTTIVGVAYLCLASLRLALSQQVNWSRAIIFCSAFAFSSMVLPASYMAYQYHSTQEIGLSKNDYGWVGYFAWMRTWVVFQKSDMERFGFQKGTPNWAGFDINNYPGRAFDSELERAQIAELTERWKKQDYTDEIDQAFSALAKTKMSDVVVYRYFALPLMRGAHLLVNFEHNTFYLRSDFLPRPFRLGMIGLFSVLSILILALAIKSACRAALSMLTRFDLNVITFAALLVCSRWALFVLLSPFLFAGLIEARYVYILWPMILFLAIHAFDRGAGDSK